MPTKQPASSPRRKASDAKGKTSPSASKKSGAKPGAVYTKPELRERLKAEVTVGDKGGRPGEWSARKAQLLAAEYKKQGGEYKKDARTGEQTHLESWTSEKWQTNDGEKAQRGDSMARYLPAKAWKALTPAEKKATDQKKRSQSRTGKQVVANTSAAKKAGARARSGP